MTVTYKHAPILDIYKAKINAMSDITPPPAIDYDQMVQDALRGVVRDILKTVAKNGLEGEQHFFVAFDTNADGVEIPPHLKERYPDEMTIVIQHRYWGLKVDDDKFEIGLSFNQKPEHLTIPYAALVGFVDPSSHFALQFSQDIELEEDPFDLDDDDETFDIPMEDESQDTRPKSTNSDKGEQPSSGGDKVVSLDQFRKK